MKDSFYVLNFLYFCFFSLFFSFYFPNFIQIRLRGLKTKFNLILIAFSNYLFVCVCVCGGVVILDGRNFFLFLFEVFFFFMFFLVWILGVNLKNKYKFTYKRKKKNLFFWLLLLNSTAMNVWVGVETYKKMKKKKWKRTQFLAPKQTNKLKLGSAQFSFVSLSLSHFEHIFI